MLMRCAFLSALILCPPLHGQDEGDEYSVREVKGALEQYRSGMHASWTEKRIHRLGDRVSVALLKLFDQSKLQDPKIIREFLPLVLEAFAYPDLISREEDKEPGVTLFFLTHLERDVSDSEVREQIAQTAKAIKDKASACTPKS